MGRMETKLKPDSVVLTKENVQTKSNLFTGDGFSHMIKIINCWMFLQYLKKGNYQNKYEFFQNTMNFESSFNNFRNVLFII